MAWNNFKLVVEIKTAEKVWGPNFGQNQAQN